MSQKSIYSGHLLLAYFLASVSLAATPYPGAMQDTDAHLDSGSQRMLTSSDTAFAIQAAQGGLAEVQLGKLAATKAGMPELKAFGQHMVDDHTKVNDQLGAIVKAKNMTLPTTVNSKDKAAHAKLNRLSGAAFDKEYVNEMIQDHKDEIKVFGDEMKHGKDPQLKQFASETEPVLGGHLDKIRNIQSEMAGKLKRNEDQ